MERLNDLILVSTLIASFISHFYLLSTIHTFERAEFLVQTSLHILYQLESILVNQKIGFLLGVIPNLYLLQSAMGSFPICERRHNTILRMNLKPLDGMEPGHRFCIRLPFCNPLSDLQPQFNRKGLNSKTLLPNPFRRVLVFLALIHLCEGFIDFCLA